MSQTNRIRFYPPDGARWPHADGPASDPSSRPRLSASTLGSKWNQQQLDFNNSARDASPQDEERHQLGSGEPGKAATSSRSRIAGYIAAKLSNLASLGYSGHNQQQQHHGSAQSCSAPPSPLNKQRKPALVTGAQQHGSILATPLRKSKSSRKKPSKSAAGGAAGGHQQAHYSAHFGDAHQPPFTISKDYGGCDFILFVEFPSSSGQRLASGGGGCDLPGGNQSASGAASASCSGGGATAGCGSGPACQVAGGGQASSGAGAGTNSGSLGPTTTTASGCPATAHGAPIGPLIIHLVAPNLQEKAAWMSDISQVSSARRRDTARELFRPRRSARLINLRPPDAVVGGGGAQSWLLFHLDSGGGGGGHLSRRLRGEHLEWCSARV